MRKFKFLGKLHNEPRIYPSQRSEDMNCNLVDELATSPEAIASCVIFYERRKDKKLFTCPRGRVFFKPVQMRPLIALVRLAAEHLGFRLPVPSFIERAELLYRNDTLTEVRACGKYVAGLDSSDKPVLRKWHTPVEPKFSLDHGVNLRPGLRDINKSYIAVLNKRQGAGVWWDLSSQYPRKVFAEGDDRHRFKFLVRREAPRSEVADLFPEAVDTAEVRESVKGLGPEALYRALMPHVPSDSSELLAVKISDPHRILIYLVDKTYVEYQLAARHALKQGCDEKVLADLVVRHGEIDECSLNR
ncbi:MAG: hypothetical protein LC800_13680 [Acidobacteria bacterium]|nr:hypothetical protein [Acidobacteriota bacterium]